MADPNQEEKLYAQAAAELDGANRRQGLWAKCFAERDGDENKAKALYLKKRVEQLKEQSRPPQHFKSNNSSNSFEPTEDQQEYGSLAQISIYLKDEFGFDVVPIQSGFFYNLYDEDAELCNRLYGHRKFEQGKHTLTGFSASATDHFEQSFAEHRLSYAFVRQHKDNSKVRIVTASSNPLALNKKYFHKTAQIKDKTQKVYYLEKYTETTAISNLEKPWPTIKKIALINAYLDDISVEEIAEELDQTTNGVKHMLEMIAGTKFHKLNEMSYKEKVEHLTV